MLRADLEHAIEEAERFLKRAKRLLEANDDPDYPYLYGPDAAAVKRASMDLTKSLPKIRRAR